MTKREKRRKKKKEVLQDKRAKNNEKVLVFEKGPQETTIQQKKATEDTRTIDAVIGKRRREIGEVGDQNEKKTASLSLYETGRLLYGHLGFCPFL